MYVLVAEILSPEGSDVQFVPKLNKKPTILMTFRQFFFQSSSTDESCWTYHTKKFISKIQTFKALKHLRHI